MKLLVCGGRHFNNYKILEWVLDNILNVAEISQIEIVSGHCEGADQLGEKYAEERELPLKLFCPNWKSFGKAAGPIRNKQMIDYIKNSSDSLVVAFVSSNSKGTKGTIQLAHKNNLPVIEIPYENIEENINLYEGIRLNSEGDLEFDWDQDEPQDVVKLEGSCINLTKFQKNCRYYEYRINVEANPEDKRSILQTIKQNADKDPRVQELIYRCAEDFYTKSPIKHFDYLIKLPSRSQLNSILTDIIIKNFDDCQALSVSKKPASELNFDWELLKKSFRGDYYSQLQDYLQKLISRLKKDDNFSITKVSPKYRRYLVPMIQIDDTDIDLKSNLLIIDDVFTTGSSIQMVLESLKQIGFEGNITILNLINNR